MCGYACYAGSRGRDAKVSQRPRPFGLMPQHCTAFQPLPACCPACTEGQPDVNVRKLSQAIPFCRLLGSCLPKSSELKGVCAKRELGYGLAFYYYYFFFLPSLGSMQTWWKCFFPDNILLCAPSTPLFIPSDQNPWAIFFRAIYIHLVGLISWFSNGHTSVWRYRHTAKFRWLLC